MLLNISKDNDRLLNSLSAIFGKDFAQISLFLKNVNSAKFFNSYL